eukprot:268041_1
MMQTCKVTIEFADPSEYGEPVELSLNCSRSSPYFPYFLRRKLQKAKRIPCIEHKLEEITSNRFKFTRKERNNLNQLTIYGHHDDEYNLQIDNNDTVIDIKFLLAALIDAKPDYIQLNYNTMRRLNDSENIIKLNGLSSSIKIMWWLEIENQNQNESPIIRSVSHLAGIHPSYPDMATSIRKVCSKYSDVKTFGVRTYLDKNDLSLRGQFEFINYKIIDDKITKLAAAFCSLGLSKKNESKVGLCSRNRREWLLCDYASTVQSIVNVPLYATLDKNAIEFITNHAE